MIIVLLPEMVICTSTSLNDRMRMLSHIRTFNLSGVKHLYSQQIMLFSYQFAFSVNLLLNILKSEILKKLIVSLQSEIFYKINF
jgi:hypothetical protein